MHEPTNAYALLFSGEFASASMESAFLNANWQSIKKMTQCTLTVIAVMGMAFFAADVLAEEKGSTLALLFTVRLIATGAIALAALHIGRLSSYTAHYRILQFFIQLLIPIAIFWVAFYRGLPAVYVGVDAILFTLVYYQFVNNSFKLTLAASVFFGLSAFAFSALFLEFNTLEMVGAFLFLIPLNYLGIMTLRSNNRAKRREYAALKESERHVNYLGIMTLRSNNRAKRREYAALKESERHADEKEKLIGDLQAALSEVKTLQGFIPICSKCMKIRDDEGFWEKIENYIQDRTDAKFSHSLCPNCAKDLYGKFIEKA